MELGRYWVWKVCFYRLVAKYRPTMPVFAVVSSRLRTDSLKWSFTSSSQVHQLFLLICLAIKNIESNQALSNSVNIWISPCNWAILKMVQVRQLLGVRGVYPFLAIPVVVSSCSIWIGLYNVAMQFSKTQSDFFVMVEMDYIIHTHYQDHDLSTKKFILPCFLRRFSCLIWLLWQGEL